MHLSRALALEYAETQYLRARVQGLASLPGNPYRACLSVSYTHLTLPTKA